MPGVEVIWVSRVEVLPVFTQMVDQWQTKLLHAHNNHLSHLIGSVWIEVSVVRAFPCLGHVWAG